MRGRTKTLMLGASAIATLLATAATGQTARTAQGVVAGTRSGDTIAFLGVPYAAAPVGPLRWRAPQPHGAWHGVRKADRFAPSCTQILNPPAGRPPWTPEFLIPGPMSEDCLYLNVWRPAATPAKPAAILVWIHGGGLSEGSGSIDAYNGAALAKRGIIVVTINYRLGVLGFLAHPGLSAEQNAISGNYGLEDAIAAVRWVKDNARAFGGDPNRITIAGQSAGSSVVNALVASPKAKGLFARVITQSGAGWPARRPAMPLASAEKIGAALAQDLGSKSLTELRAMPAEALFKSAADFAAKSKVSYSMVIDGRVLPTEIMTAQTTSAFNDTPFLSGFNANEDSGMDTRYGMWTLAELGAKRASVYGPAVADRIANIFPATTDAEAGPAGKLMMAERSRAQANEWARRRAAVTHNPIYVYYFDHPLPGPTQARYGTFHTGEVPYVFGNFDPSRPITAEDRKVADRMGERWVNFINGGSPDAKGYPAWPAYDPAHPLFLRLGDGEAPMPPLPAGHLEQSELIASQP